MNHHIQVLPRMRALAFIAAALATTALSAHAGTTQTDPITGQVWQIFDHVLDGEAQGYRRATVDDFKQLLADSNWLLRNGTTSVYDLTTGANTYANGTYSFNAPSIDFGWGLASKAKNDYWNAPSVVAAWLQDGGSGNVMGLLERGSTGFSSCSFSHNYGSGCTTNIYYQSSAEIASSSELVAKFAPGNYPSTLTGKSMGTTWSDIPFDPLYSYRQLDSTIRAGTFMIASVPEPSNAALLSLGLMGIVAAVRVRRSQQDDHLG